MAYLIPIMFAYVVWLMFLAVMALQSKWSKLPIIVKVIAIPAVVIAVMLDILLNITVGTMLFLDLPSQWTFSQRISQYKKRIDWRSTVASWICSNLLDPFEIGGHCK